MAVLTNDRRTVLVRVVFLGLFGVIACAGSIVLILNDHPIEGMAMFGLATTVAGMIGGAPRSADPPVPPPVVTPPPPPTPAPAPAPAPVEAVTLDTLQGWIAGAEKWGPDNLEAH